MSADKLDKSANLTYMASSETPPSGVIGSL
jgi:hypothetical protein